MFDKSKGPFKPKGHSSYKHFSVRRKWENK